MVMIHNIFKKGKIPKIMKFNLDYLKPCTKDTFGKLSLPQWKISRRPLPLHQIHSRQFKSRATITNFQASLIQL